MIAPKMGTTTRPPEPERKRGKAHETLGNALFSRTQQRILGLLFGQPARSFFTREIIREAAGGVGAVQRELARLEKSGLVNVTRVGNQKHYQANKDSPIFPELRRLIIKTVGIAEPIRKVLEPLSRQIRYAAIYGSMARGDDRAGSDIDLLVVANDLSLEDLFRTLAPVEPRLGRRINPTIYTESEFRRRAAEGNPFLKKVLAGEKLTVMGNVDEL